MVKIQLLMKNSCNVNAWTKLYLWMEGVCLVQEIRFTVMTWINAYVERIHLSRRQESVWNVLQKWFIGRENATVFTTTTKTGLEIVRSVWEIQMVPNVGGLFFDWLSFYKYIKLFRMKKSIDDIFIHNLKRKTVLPHRSVTINSTLFSKV